MHTQLFPLVVISSDFLFLVPISDKVSGAVEPRDLAAEGLYVGRRPLVQSEDRNKMENRLLQEHDGAVSH